MKRVLQIIICLLFFSLLMTVSVSATAEGEKVQSTVAAAQENTIQKTLPQVENARFKKSDTSSVTLMWDKVQQADRYYIYHYNPIKKQFEYIGQTTETESPVTGLTAGSTYKFRIRAVSFATGQKQWGHASNDIIAVTAPDSAVTLRTKTITKNSITLYWDALEGATGYKLFYYSRQQGKYVPLDHTNKTSMTVDALEENTFYSFKLRAYRWSGDAISYGEYSNVYLECTDKSGVPRTLAQSAKAYNTAVNNAKNEKTMTVKYTKTIDTEFLLCDVENLTSSVKNTLNLYDGTMNRTYSFTDGKSGKITPSGLFEPYGKAAQIERDDIELCYIKKNADGYTVRLVLKSEESFFDSENQNGEAGSYYDDALSLPNYKTLDTTPLKIKKADSYHSAGSFSFIVQNGKLTCLKLRCDVVSAIDFSVATLNAGTTIMYSLNENYFIKYRQ